MDLGLVGKKAIICASSRGLGKACARSLAREGVDIIINGRDAGVLESVADELREETDADVTPIAADIGTDEGRHTLVAACPTPDILINNNAGPPPGMFQGWGEEQWHDALGANLLAPVFMIKSVIGGMQERGFGRIVNITSAMVKNPHPALGLSTAARSALTALCKGLSKDVAKDNVTINNLLPERFDTNRQKQMAELVAAMKGISVEEEREAIRESIAAKRMGEPSEFGDACAFLCGAQAGFISGQNLQLDGGSYPGLI